ncbi:hypothetical protein QJS04_geneDACA021348 [Acorus gramineus]|uniref:Uncharacterized protein n=1 Tax=Acorus gramineus TaxID=55184 RepID=A0AAV9BN28_ACOGR|nr:hypothetical protein QJS04_geneDACA021348 [Acorus gramineus]
MDPSRRIEQGMGPSLETAKVLSFELLLFRRVDYPLSTSLSTKPFWRAFGFVKLWVSSKCSWKAIQPRRWLGLADKVRCRGGLCEHQENSNLSSAP